MLETQLLIPVVSLDRQQVLDNLCRTRIEWERAVEGESLLETNSNTGMILIDFCNILGLNIDEIKYCLGNQLFKESLPILFRQPNS